MGLNGRIAADIARTDNDHFFADPAFVSFGCQQKIKSRNGPVIAGNRKAYGFLSPGGNNQKVKIFLELQDVLRAQRLLKVDARNHLFDPINLCGNDLLGNAAFRDNPRYFSAQGFRQIVNGDSMTTLTQLPGN